MWFKFKEWETKEIDLIIMYIELSTSPGLIVFRKLLCLVMRL